LWQTEYGNQDEGSSNQNSEDVRCISLSADGRMTASGSYSGLIMLWDAVTGLLLDTFRGNSKGVFAVAFSPDSSLIACGCDNGPVRIWGVQGQGLIRTLREHSLGLWVVAVNFSPDSESVVSLAVRGEIIVWDVKGGGKLAILQLEVELPDPHVSFSVDGTCIIVRNRDSALSWSLPSRQEPLGVGEVGDSQMKTLSKVVKNIWRHPWRKTLNLRIEDRHVIPHDQLSQPYHYWRGSDWIMDRQKKHVCWIPPDCRNSIFDVQGKTVALWPRGGRLIVVDFSDVSPS